MLGLAFNVTMRQARYWLLAVVVFTALNVPVSVVLGIELRDLFGRHVGSEVALRALDDGVTLGGEEREVGVLFVDVVGPTAFTSRHDPAEVVAALNDFFGIVVEAVQRHGGLVNKFEGDAALWCGARRCPPATRPGPRWPPPASWSPASTPRTPCPPRSACRPARWWPATSGRRTGSSTR